jgi:hypothetical protein
MKLRLTDAYKYPGFRPLQYSDKADGDSQNRIVIFKRFQKKQNVLNAAKITTCFMTGKCGWSEIYPAETLRYISNLRSGV